MDQLTANVADSVKIIGGWAKPIILDYECRIGLGVPVWLMHQYMHTYLEVQMRYRRLRTLLGTNHTLLQRFVEHRGNCCLKLKRHFIQILQRCERR